MTNLQTNFEISVHLKWNKKPQNKNERKKCYQTWYCEKHKLLIIIVWNDYIQIKWKQWR